MSKSAKKCRQIADTGRLQFASREALGLTKLAGLTLADTRTGRNIQHDQVALLRPVHVPGAEDWRQVLEPVAAR